jgi:ammonia channel protein AmtB
VYGNWFEETTSVTFGGVAADTFTVVSQKELMVVVPEGALTGQIGITTPGGTVLTTAQFVVGQPAPFVLYGPQQVKPPIPPGV